jgi:hypothetical protein
MSEVQEFSNLDLIINIHEVKENALAKAILRNTPPGCPIACGYRGIIWRNELEFTRCVA